MPRANYWELNRIFLQSRLPSSSDPRTPNLLITFKSAFLQPHHHLHIGLFLDRTTTSNRTMQPLSILTVLVTVAGVAAAPFKFPTPDGFPNVTPTTFAQIEHIAGGSLPNGPLPTSLKPTAVTVLQLLSVNELFEVAFFTELLANVTNNVPGYDVSPLDKGYVSKSLSAIVAVSHLSSRPPLTP